MRFVPLPLLVWLLLAAGQALGQQPDSTLRTTPSQNMPSQATPWDSTGTSKLRLTNNRGQVATIGTDSTIAAKDSSIKKLRKPKVPWPNPNRALWMSFVLPGLGQAYNRSWWKIPIVTGAVGTGLYFGISEHLKYVDYRDRYRADPSNLTYKSKRDFHINNRDLAFILTSVAYTLTAVEAYTHAHLKGFKMTDDLSLHLSPSAIPYQAWGTGVRPGVAAGATISLRFR